MEKQDPAIAPVPLPVKLLFILGAALALGGALLAANMLRHGAHPAAAARVGETVEVPGGLLRVERVIPEYMAPMHGQGSGQSTLTMSGMDMAPAGYRRFTVEISLSAESPGGLRITQDTFQLGGDGMQAVGPTRAALGTELIPQGSRAAVNLTFQVPETAHDLRLSLQGSERPIAIELPAADEHHHAPDKNHGAEDDDQQKEQAPHTHEDHEH